jgi:uncharacterized protein YqhQ
MHKKATKQTIINIRIVQNIMSNPQALDIGGQAVIEGVLMKKKEKLAIAVRLENGKIKLKKEILKPLPKILKIPFIRGLTTLIYISIIGIKALVWSANQSLEEEEELSTLELVGTLTLSLLFATLFFIGIPFATTKLIRLEGIWFNIVEGIIRLAIFVLYVYVISFMKDIKRMFQYHGAEHMAANCYEFNKPLTVKNVSKYSTIHPRCGTSFIMLVLIISIILYSFITTEIWYYKLLWRIILIPVVAGVSYELLRLGGKFRSNWFMNILIAPGKWVQKITTQTPDYKMIEVAITALKAVIR